MRVVAGACSMQACSRWASHRGSAGSLQCNMLMGHALCLASTCGMHRPHSSIVLHRPAMGVAPLTDGVRLAAGSRTTVAPPTTSALAMEPGVLDATEASPLGVASLVVAACNAQSS